MLESGNVVTRDSHRFVIDSAAKRYMVRIPLQVRS